MATWALERDDTELKIPYMNMAKEVKWKLDPVGSTVGYEMMKLCTESV